MFTIFHPNKQQDNCNVVIDFSIEKLRGRLARIMSKELKKIKPDGDSISWITKLGTFCIFKDYEYDNNWEPHKSKFKTLYLYVELDKRKQGGEVETRKYAIKKIINQECDDLDECFVCNSKMIESFKIKQWGEMVNVCKKCKDFDNKLEQISKKLDDGKSKKILKRVKT